MNSWSTPPPTPAMSCSRRPSKVKPISEEMIRKALRLGTLSGKLTPVHCGSSKEFHGVRLLLDAVRDYLPSPLDRPAVQGIDPKTKEAVERKPDPKEPFSALAFKTVSEKHGDLVFLRIYSGQLQPGDTCMNTGQQTCGADQPHLSAVRRSPRSAGSGRAGRDRGGGRSEADAHRPHPVRQDQPILLEEIRFPEPVISQSITPAKNVDETKLADALGKMVRDDPTLQVPHRPGDEPAHPLRHGRTAPGGIDPQARARPRRQGRAGPAAWSPTARRWPSRWSWRRATSSSPAAAASTPSST